jgi:hypothetical protein
MVENFACFNPHATLSLQWFDQTVKFSATNPKWQKWLPSDPTVPGWYSRERRERLIAGYIADDEDHGKDRTVREFVSEFHGLTSTAKQKRVLEATGLARTNLSALKNGSGLNHELIDQLWEALCANGKPIKAKRLGVIGREHLATRLKVMGCLMDSFKYKLLCQDKDADGLPSVGELVFALCPRLAERRVITGVNWSGTITNPFRHLGKLGRSLDELLEVLMVSVSKPVVVLLHVACPAVKYTDRAKSTVVIPGQPYRAQEEEE